MTFTTFMRTDKLHFSLKTKTATLDFLWAVNYKKMPFSD